MIDLLPKTKIHSLFLQESGKMLRQLIEESRTGVYIADEQGNLVYVNQAFVHILGYMDRNEVLGRNLARELYVHPEDRKIFLKAMENTGFVRDYEVKNLRRDKSVVVLSVTSNVIRDDADQVIGIEGMVHDITQKKKIEDSLKEEKEKLTLIMGLEANLNRIHHIDELSKFAVEQIARLFQARKCSIMLYNEESKELYIQAAKGLSGEIIKNARKKVGEPIAGVVVQNRQPILVANIEYDKQFQHANRLNYDTRSFVCVPILAGPRCLGVLSVTDKYAGAGEVFSDIDLSVLCAAAHALGIALENAHSYSFLENLAYRQPWNHLRRLY